MTEYIYYAKPIKAPNHMEQVVLEMPRPLVADEMDRLHAGLARQGMEYVRVWEYNGGAPDFTKVVNL